MDSETRKRLEQEAHRLVLAESDMRQASAAASHLRAFGAEMNGNAERALWTGMIVSYARPFLSSNKIGAVGGRLARPDEPVLRPLHSELKRLRRELAAHNDVTSDREAVDTAAMLGLGSGRFGESWRTFNTNVLPAVERLADTQEARFRRRREDVQRQLSSDGH